VDDIICLFKGNKNTAKELLNYINKLSPTIKFTGKFQEKAINYLDITITKGGKNINLTCIENLQQQMAL
jgi:hypothetical protein